MIEKSRVAENWYAWKFISPAAGRGEGAGSLRLYVYPIQGWCNGRSRRGTGQATYVTRDIVVTPGRLL